MQPCGGAIPLCMVQEFDLPMEIIDRKVGALSALLWESAGLYMLCDSRLALLTERSFVASCENRTAKCPE